MECRILSHVQAYKFERGSLIDAVPRMTHLTCLRTTAAGKALDLTHLAHALLDRPVARPRPLVVLHRPIENTTHHSLVPRLADQNVEFRVESLW